MGSDVKEGGTELAPAGYQDWYAWAQREIGGDPNKLQRATNAALAALNRGMGAEGAAREARFHTTTSVVDYDLGKVGVDSGDFVILAIDDSELLRIGVDHVKAVQISPAPDNGGSLAVFIDGESAWRQFAGCRPVAAADQMVRSISAAYPNVTCTWATLSLAERKTILDGQIHGWVSRGYRVTFQSDSSAQLVREKGGVNSATVIVLLIISLFAFFIPIIIYLIWASSSRKSEGVLISVDEYGRVTESKTK